ncbi:FCS-Like Zinc finger 5-like [Wolffia australiana]
MLLGKRPRPEMRKTTSFSEIIFDVGGGGASDGNPTAEGDPPCYWRQHQLTNGGEARYAAAMVSPRFPRRNSSDFAAVAAPFLKTCGLCKRRLGPGKDTFMYRGEVAFCSLECRQQHIALEERRERKERCSLATAKKNAVTTKGGELEGS